MKSPFVIVMVVPGYVVVSVFDVIEIVVCPIASSADIVVLPIAVEALESVVAGPIVYVCCPLAKIIVARCRVHTFIPGDISDVP